VRGNKDLITIYVTENKARTIEKVKAKHPQIHTSLGQTQIKQPQLVRSEPQHRDRIAYVLTPAEFAALPESAIAGAKVVRD
jgi:hypothetical protein